MSQEVGARSAGRSDRIQFALMFANAGPFAYPEPFAHLVRTAEDVGFESALAIDHVVVPEGYASQYPYDVSGRMPGPEDVPMADPLIALAYAAAMTERIQLGTGVLVLPQRNPAVVAKQVATLDLLSNGRALLGVGVGWLCEEFEALGVHFDHRASRTEESIHAIRSLWQKGAKPFDGEHFQWKPVHCEPRPFEGRSVPIHIGGHTEAAAKRAARIGDGYFPLGVDEKHLARLLQVMREECERIGRDHAEIEITTGPISPDLGAIHRLSEMGVHRAVITPPGFDPETVRKCLEQFGDQIIARV